MRTIETIEVERFFEPVPYRNYFQYPPMVALGSVRDLETGHLAIDDNARRDDFTIFVSVPFCRVRCHSCPYYVEKLPQMAVADEVVDDYARRILLQIRRLGEWPRWKTRRCAAVFFGGGTASLLPASTVGTILTVLKAHFEIDTATEITLEGNTAMAANDIAPLVDEHRICESEAPY